MVLDFLGQINNPIFTKTINKILYTEKKKLYG